MQKTIQPLDWKTAYRVCRCVKKGKTDKAKELLTPLVDELIASRKAQFGKLPSSIREGVVEEARNKAFLAAFRVASLNTRGVGLIRVKKWWAAIGIVLSCAVALLGTLQVFSKSAREILGNNIRMPGIGIGIAYALYNFRRLRSAIKEQRNHFNGVAVHIMQAMQASLGPSRRSNTFYGAHIDADAFFRGFESFINEMFNSYMGGQGGYGYYRESAPIQDTGMSYSKAYEILGVSPGDGKDQIQIAWKRKMKEYYPGVNANDPAALEAVQKANAARDFLIPKPK